MIGALALMAITAACNLETRVFTARECDPEVCAEPDDPYRHVLPADEGVEFGVGVVGPSPTESYLGPSVLDVPTTIEDKVIDGCLVIQSNDVVLRNVLLTCGGQYPLSFRGPAANATVEYSRIDCTSAGKAILVSDYRNLVVRNSRILGCSDSIFVRGDVDGLRIEASQIGGAASMVFHVGQPETTTGQIIARGNYFDAPDGSATDLFFGEAYDATDLLFENNFLTIWGLRTLRFTGAAGDRVIRYNVYARDFADMYHFSSGKLVFIATDVPVIFRCNRYETGSLLEELADGIDRMAGASPDERDCPPLP